jgi:hypothetical protein
LIISEQEYARLKAIEDAVRYALAQEGDDICWRDLYSKLSGLLGIDFMPKLMESPEKMKANCSRFIDSLYDGPYVPIHVRLNPDDAKKG